MCEMPEVRDAPKATVMTKTAPHMRKWQQTCRERAMYMRQKKMKMNFNALVIRRRPAWDQLMRVSKGPPESSLVECGAES